MARTWGNLARQFEAACRLTARATQERWDHLAEGQRWLAGQLDLPELIVTDENVTVALGADYVEKSAIDFSVYAIDTVYNVTDGIPMRPEPSGMLGRLAMLEKTTGKPPSGQLMFYQSDGTRLYVRNTAAATTTLKIRAKRQMPDLSDADLALTPITPAQYDRALIHAAAHFYFLLHADENTTGGENPEMMSSKHLTAAQSLIATPASPRIEENLPRTETVRVAGFNFAPRSMGRR